MARGRSGPAVAGGVVVLAAALLVAAAPARAAGGREQADAERASASRGGTLKIGIQPVKTLDPHLATSVGDIQVLEQVYEHLTYIDQSNSPVPDLAVHWESTDGRSWTFMLREGATFSDGRPVTANDVVYSFNRLRDPQVGAPVVDLYRNIREVRALGRRQVLFQLAEPEPEFPSDVGDYHAAIIPAGTVDPAVERVGSGPFTIAFHLPRNRVILERNPHYDRLDAAGLRLPYLDGIQMILSGSQEQQVEALRRGELAFVGGLTTRMVKSLRASRRTRIVTVDANMHWVIHLRSDPGHVAADNRIRRALKLATNHQGLVDAIRPRLASVGNGFTPIGPAFGRYHLVRPPFPDVAEAKRLLAEAGYADGLAITLHTPAQHEAERIATVWKDQVAKAGVDVEVRLVPVDLYYGAGKNSWLEADFAVTDWGARATPASYFKLAYNRGAPWNESHWSDLEFDRITGRLDRELDENNRARLYHEAQEILIERGPVIVVYFVKAVAGIDARLHGVTLASDWPRTRFRDAYLGK